MFMKDIWLFDGTGKKVHNRAVDCMYLPVFFFFFDLVD